MAGGIADRYDDVTLLVVEAKGWIRVSQDNLDVEEELRQTIDAAIVDLQTAGVNTEHLENSLIRQAIKLYVKANFGYDEDSEKYDRRYEKVKNTIASSTMYKN